MTAQNYAVLTMAVEAGGGVDKAQRFRAAALPYLDDVYTLARYLLRNAADAEDAAQECFRYSSLILRRVPQPSSR